MKQIHLVRVLSLVLGLLISHFTFAQHFADNWVFGDFGLKFQDDTVLIRHDFVPHDNRGDGIISDKNGDLLFYSDGFTVWNKNHGVMPNGKNVFIPVGTPKTDESIVIPKPGSESLYYLFTVNPQDGSSNSGLYASTIDIRLDHGLGDVSVKGQKIMNTVSNRITAVYHKNHKDVWLIVHEYNSSNLSSFLITASGISALPVISKVGKPITYSFDGQLKASPDGKKVASSYYSTNGEGFDLFDFDNSTGKLSNSMSFILPGPNNGCNGIEFSPDATKLFVYQTGSTSYSGLYEYIVTSRLFDEINNSRVLIMREYNNSFRQMQLAPNGKIYITKGGGGNGDKHLGVIANPNEYGIACNAKENSLFLDGGSSFVASTPNFIQNYFFKTDFTFENICQLSPVNFNITNDYRLDSVRWYFGEGSSSNSIHPAFEYPKAGDYSIRLLAYYPDKTDTIIHQITIYPFSKIDLGKDTSVCVGHEFSVVQGFKSYLWNTGATTPWIRIMKEGMYKVRVENSFGCYSSDSVYVNVVDLPVIELPDSIKMQESGSVHLSAGAFNSYSWSTGETTASIEVTKEGWYSVEVVNVSGCSAVKSVFVYINSNPGSEVKTGWKLLNPLPSARIARDICFISNQVGFIINDKELLSTTDGGNTWKVKMEISSGNRMAFKNGIGYIVGNGGSIYKSTHLGEGWNKLDVPFFANLNAISLISQDMLVITGIYNIYVSTNGGQSWETIEMKSGGIVDSYFTSIQVGHVGLANGTILKTIDGGHNWKVTSSVITAANVSRIYFIDENIGFACRGNSDLLKTTDGGETWIKVRGTTGQIYSYFFLDQQNGFIAGENGVIYTTSDGGSTWVGSPNGRYSGSVNVCFIDVARGFAIGSSGRILKTIDGGLNWESYSPSYSDIRQLDFVSDQVAIGLAGNSLIKTTDGGIHWTNIGAPVKGGRIINFDFINETMGYCIAGSISTNANQVYKTIDGGITWMITNNGKSIITENLYSIDFVNESTGYVSGGDSMGATFKTIDGGNTWQKINNIIFGGMQFISPSVGYARMGRYYSKSIYKTIDGGIHWTITFDATALNSFHFLDENMGYVVGINSSIYKTTDGGKIWQQLPIPNANYVNVRFYSSNVGYITNERSELYQTVNGGANWELVDKPYNVTGIETYGDRLFLYGGNGIIMEHSIDIKPISLFANQATNISTKSVTFSGTVASNGGTIENIRFVYGTALLDKLVPVGPETVSQNTSVNTSVDLNNLKPNTSYSYQLRASYNGVEYSSKVVQFKTLPEIQLSWLYVQDISSNSVTLSGTVISNEPDITKIEFEYGTDTLFTQSIVANPGSLAGGTTVTAIGKLTLLEPGTNYFTRIKVTYNETKVVSSIVSFKTIPEYTFNLYNPRIIGLTSATITAYLGANSDTIKNIVLEYGTLRNYDNVIPIIPSQVIPNNYAYLETQLANLDPNTTYFYRFKATMGSKTIYSTENILRLSGGVVIIPIEVQKISDACIRLQGLINTYGRLICSIQIEYGTTDELGDSIFCTPQCLYGTQTNIVQAVLDGLLPNKKYHFRINARDVTAMYYSEKFTYTTGPTGNTDLMEDLQSVTVFPNPTSQFLNVQSTYPIDRIELMDSNGRILKEKKNDQPLDISNYPVGLYFLKVYTNHGYVIKKIVKN
ncbi:MAG TPA: YCF48-related protein [Prolixibacteraceae bacterium]|jgi:photosystem II stability/assembly factor-like uncharacterized protein